MQSPHLAERTYAKVKEQLYRREIPWKKIVRSAGETLPLFEDKIEVAIKPSEKRIFICKAALHSRYKKAQDGEEWYLVTIKITITPQKKGLKAFRSRKGNKISSKTYNYQILVHDKPL